MVLSARMQFDGLHLSYCTNIHPGEDLPSVRRALGAHVARVKALVSPDAPFGLGLRLGNTAAATLHADAGERAALVAELGRLDMYVFTLNGFPYGDFAATSVKAAVYEPSWLDAERIAYTTRLAEVLADLPGPPRRTISTVSGCFRPTADDDAAHARIARNLGEVATELARIADRTGVGVRLCLEPEPWTTLETTDDAIDLFERHLFPLGAPARDHLGLCYDCCHQAVHFEDAAESVGRLHAAGVPIGKVQVSSALHLDRPGEPSGRARLQAFDEPRYLHQVVARRRDGGILRGLDLPDVSEPTDAWLDADAWRCHFHVPIWWTGDDRLGTTADEWKAAVRAVVAGGHCDQLEIETYTWDVIPPEERARLAGGDLHACIASEFEALKSVVRS